MFQHMYAIHFIAWAMSMQLVLRDEHLVDGPWSSLLIMVSKWRAQVREERRHSETGKVLPT